MISAVFVRHLYLLALILTTAATAGCLGPRRTVYQSSQPIAITDRSEQDRLWEAAQDTLRRHRFQLDRVDRRAGVITTLPVSSQHFFEFWRHDVDSRLDFWEATLNPLRRWVEVTVIRGGDRVWTGLTVAVHKEQLSSPDRQFNSTGAAYQYFGDSLPSTAGLAKVTAEHDVWLDAGKDPAMEEYLLRKILDRAGIQRPTGKSVPQED